MTIIDLSLKNNALYAGCEIEEVAGRLNLTTPVDQAVNIVGRNVSAIVEAASDRGEVVLTGPMAVWAYLVVFHAVVHAFARVYYDYWTMSPARELRIERYTSLPVCISRGLWRL